MLQGHCSCIPEFNIMFLQNFWKNFKCELRKKMWRSQLDCLFFSFLPAMNFTYFTSFIQPNSKIVFKGENVVFLRIKYQHKILKHFLWLTVFVCVVYTFVFYYMRNFTSTELTKSVWMNSLSQLLYSQVYCFLLVFFLHLIKQKHVNNFWTLHGRHLPDCFIFYVLVSVHFISFV